MAEQGLRHALVLRLLQQLPALVVELRVDRLAQLRIRVQQAVDGVAEGRGQRAIIDGASHHTQVRRDATRVARDQIQLRGVGISQLQGRSTCPTALGITPGCHRGLITDPTDTHVLSDAADIERGISLGHAVHVRVLRAGPQARQVG